MDSEPKHLRLQDRKTGFQVDLELAPLVQGPASADQNRLLRLDREIASLCYGDFLLSQDLSKKPPSDRECLRSARRHIAFRFDHCL